MGFIRRYKLRKMTNNQLQVAHFRAMQEWEETIAQGIDTRTLMREVADIERVGKERNVDFALMD